MKQNQYEAIVTCIQYGAPALAQDLINAFVQTVQNSNNYITAQQKAAQEKAAAEKAAQEKIAAEKAAKEANLGLKVTKTK